MIVKNSRYEGSEFTGIRGVDGVVRRYVHARVPLTKEDVSGDVVIHTTETGQEMDELTFRFAKKPLLWWLLADVNDIIFPLEPKPGTELLIPTQELRARKEP
jgi:hypothetical protein